MANKRKVPEINSSSMADISFLLLIFFLVTTSMSVDKGLARRLPPPVTDPSAQNNIKVKERNVLVVLLNSNNQLMVGGQLSEIGDLRERAKEFVVNAGNRENLPELTDTTFQYLGNFRYTKNHVISLQNDRGTEYNAYIEVQNELIAAYNELRDQLARERFGVSFKDMDENDPRREEIRTVFDQKISEAEPKNYGGGSR